MFFKILKNKILLPSLLALFIIPNTILAYSDYIIAGGENIGIELNSKGVIIVGTYDVSGVNPASKAGLQTGDKIIKVNNTDITNIEDMLSLIEKTNNKENISITYMRGTKENTTNLKLSKTELLKIQLNDQIIINNSRPTQSILLDYNHLNRIHKSTQYNVDNTELSTENGILKKLVKNNK